MHTDKWLERPLSRRAFGTGAITAGAGAAGATLFGGALGSSVDTLFSPTSASAAAAITDTDILNFALNLEYLEAEFYTVLTTGKRLKDFGIPTSGAGASGPTTGGRKLDLAPWMKEVLDEVTYDEQQHVILLRDALGGAAVAKPAIDLAGVSAAGFGFGSVGDVLALARAFEDVGVSAYGGAARAISSRDVLEVAARIALTEAEHAGNIRLMVAQQNVPTFALDANDYPPPPSGDKYFNVSRAALAKIRTTSMVLAILYGRNTAGTAKGGFFPNGLNGTIHVV
jgi:hypothetical protein